MTRVAPYSAYAGIYDRIGQRAFGERISGAALARLAPSLGLPGRAADLACGTGAATLVLAAAGWRVTGVDRSPEMLDAARLAGAGSGAEWLEQDLRDLRLPERVSLATCFYDSLNYVLESDDLDKIFARVADSLVGGGWFVFDLNTRHRLAEGWDNGLVIVADTDDLLVMYRSWFDPATDRSPLVMTAFQRDRSGHGQSWMRFDEEHIERAYPLDDVKAMLERNGLPTVECLAYDDRTHRFVGPASEASERAVYFARKRSDPPPIDPAR